MGETARALGKNQSTIDYKGTTYTLTELDYDGIAAFEVWCEGEAIKTARRMKAILSPNEAAEYWDETIRQINSKVYTHGSKECAQFAMSKAGRAETLRIAMLKNHPEVADGKIPAQILNEMYEEVVEAMNRANHDPNLAAPETPGTTGQSQNSSPTSPESPSSSDPGK